MTGPGSAFSMPAAGHTDDRGNWHWGNAADRMARVRADAAPKTDPEREARFSAKADRIREQGRDGLERDE